MGKKYLSYLSVCFIAALLSGCVNADVARYNKTHQGQVQKNEQAPALPGSAVSYSLVDYEELPADLMAMVNLEGKQAITKVYKGIKDNQYVFIGLGRKPTGGYTVKVDKVENNGKELFVYYKVITPPTGAIVTQVITYPWAMIKVVSSIPVTKIIKK